MTPPLRIVHVSAYFAPAYAFGGPPRSLLSLCRAQQSVGLDVEMFTTTANPGADLAPAPDGREIDGVRARYFPVSSPRMLLGASSMAAPLAAALADADVAHLHGLFNRTVWMGSELAQRARVPTVVSPRGMLEPAALAHHARRKQLSWAVRDRRVMEAATCWHATAVNEAETLRARDGRRRVVEIPNCVEPVIATGQEIDRARTVAGVPAGSRYVLMLGRIHPIKRLDLLARAFAPVADAWADVHLVIAGPDEGGHRAAVEPLFAPSASRVHWCGAVDQSMKHGLLAGASALVACSDSESFGMSIAEALSAAVPVVVTHTCPWQVIEPADCGFWVPQSAEAVAGGLSAILQHPDQARAKGARGQMLARREFSAEAVGARWATAYAECVAGDRRGRAAP